MNKAHSVLAGLLVVQLLLVGLLYWHNLASVQEAEPAPLLSLQSAAVDKLVIADNTHSLVLEREDDKWRLPQRHHLPALNDKVEELLSKLEAIQVGWPVASTSGSQERFKVSENNFQRRLQIYAGDKKLGEVFLGTSPSFRKVHVRRAGENEIYAISLAAHELSTAAPEWLDKTLLSVNGVQEISGPDYSLKKADDAWTFADNAGSENKSPPVDAEKATALADAFAQLRILDVSETLPPGESLVIRIKDGQQDRQYEFFKNKDKYYVKRDDLPLVFTVSQFDYDRITQIRQSQLAVQQQEEKRKANPLTEQKEQDS